MKLKKQLVTFVSTMMIACVLCGCGKPEKKLVGTWSASFDMVPVLEEAMGDDFEGFTAQPAMIYITFEEDGTYRVYADRESASATINEWEIAVRDFYVEKTYKDMEEKGYDADQTEELYQKTYECSCKDYVEKIIVNSINKDEMIENVSSAGSYSATKKELTMKNSETSEDICYSYKIERNVLKLDSSDKEPDKETDAQDASGYPMEFTKVEE